MYYLSYNFELKAQAAQTAPIVTPQKARPMLGLPSFTSFGEDVLREASQNQRPIATAARGKRAAVASASVAVPAAMPTAISTAMAEEVHSPATAISTAMTEVDSPATAVSTATTVELDSPEKRQEVTAASALAAAAVAAAVPAGTHGQAKQATASIT